jgi:L-ascorbate metabolism protein UlaG (beta-lactamase superfamily)
MMDAAPVEITLIGGPTVMIEIDGIRLVTDPTFDPPGPHPSGAVKLEKTEGPALSAEEVGPVDAVLLSHDQHVDNFDRAGRRFAENAKVVLTTDAANRRLGGNSVGLKPWRSYRLGGRNGLTVVATPARHGPPGAERTLGDVTGFVVQSAAKKDLIYVTGDTVFYDGVAEVARRYKPDVVIAFAGAARTRGPFNLTMGNNDLLELASVFRGARIMTVHNRGWKHFTEGPDSVAAAAEIFAPQGQVQSLVPGRKWVLSVDSGTPPSDPHAN